MLLKPDCGATCRSDQIRSDEVRSFLGSPALRLHEELCQRVPMAGWPLRALAPCPSCWRGLLCAVGQGRQDLCLGCLPLLFVQPPARPSPTAATGSQGWSLLWNPGLIPQRHPSAKLMGQGLRATSVVSSSMVGWGQAVLEGAAPFSIPSPPWGPGGSVCVPTRVRSVLGCSDVLSKCQPSGYSVLYVWKLQTLQLSQ